MQECSYIVCIEYINKKITGTLYITWIEEFSDSFFNLEEKSKKIVFNPLYILGDLRNQEDSYEYPYGRKNITQPYNLSTSLYEYEYGFGEPIYVGNDEKYSSFVKELTEIIPTQKYKSIKSLEALAKKYLIDLNCEIKLQKPKKELLLTRNPEKNDIFEKIIYKYGERNCDLVKNNYLNKNHQIHYYCNSVTEIVYSIYHFLVLHNYKFKICALCQKSYLNPFDKGRNTGCKRKVTYKIEPYLADKQKQQYLRTQRTCQDTLSFLKKRIRNNVKCINQFWENHPKRKDFMDSYYEMLNRYRNINEDNLCFKNLENLYFLTCKDTRKRILYLENKRLFEEEKKKLEEKLQQNATSV